VSKKTVYIETSILSAYVDERNDIVSRFQRRQTIGWWRRERSNYSAYASELVLAELQRTKFPGQRRAVAMARALPALPVTDAVVGVAKVYEEHLVMPRGNIGDAYHLALACVHEMDCLLTWNCRHLANANKTAHIQAVNLRLGLLTPLIVTPQMLIQET
jgi:hypothetical protein